MKYYITIEEIRNVVVEVEASDNTEAYNKVIDAYSEGDICLNNDNYMVESYLNDDTDKYTREIDHGFIPDRFKKI